jgi:hypothetical protein
MPITVIAKSNKIYSIAITVIGISTILRFLETVKSANPVVKRFEQKIFNCYRLKARLHTQQKR